MSLLSPASIAVIGASHTPGKVGHDILRNLLTQGYTGAVYPVNPKGGTILGRTAYPSIHDIPEAVEMAVIVIPAEHVAGALCECGEKGVHTVVIISAGFSETHTEEGAAREQAVKEIAKKYDLQLIGPNCLGILRPSISLNASFAKELPATGSIAFLSQSGATAVALMDDAALHGLRFSSVISLGNKAVLDETDMLQICAEDTETNVIGLYLESIKDGRRFLAACAAVAGTKHIVLLKAGVSEHGKKAAASHTGALAGSDGAIDALCAQAGIHRARNLEEFFDLLSVLSQEPPLLSSSIAIVTNAGGPGILATDSAEAHGLHLPALTPEIEAALKTTLPVTASTANPIDVLGDSGADRFEAALTACREDAAIDGCIVLLTPQVMTPCEEIAKTVIRVFQKNRLMPVVCSFMGGASVETARTILREHGIPTFETPERAVRAMAALRKSQEMPTKKSEQEASISECSETARALLQGKHGLLDEDSTKALLALYHLPLPRQALAQSSDEAASVAQQIGFPVIAKISSPDIAHKTDVGGVRANLKTAEEVRAAFDAIMQDTKSHLPTATLQGVLIQQFLPVGDEFIVGSVRDPSFGPLVLVGLGGIYTELFRDTALRIAPVTEAEAYSMLSHLVSWKLLLGMRGKAQADIEALARLVVTVSRIATDCPEILEFDLNPVLVHPDGLAIADVKIILGKETSK